MAKKISVTLHDLFADWGADQPARLVDLMNADIEKLDDKARSLRALAVQLVHSFEREPVYTAGHARSMLERHHLPARRNKWCAVALDADREREYVRAEGGAMRLNHTVSMKVPVPENVLKRAPLPSDGRYLIIYGGSPEVLGVDATAEAVAQLRREVPVADVLFWDESGEAAAFYSLGAGVGQRGSEVVEFPDPALLEKAREA